MLIVTTDSVPGSEIGQTLGLARGSAARSRNIGADFFASIKNVVGGEVSQYTKLMAETREQALERLAMDAQRMGADAVVAVRFDSSSVAQGANEITAYGTAVKLAQKGSGPWSG